jgi:hypothetical protein
MRPRRAAGLAGLLLLAAALACNFPGQALTPTPGPSARTAVVEEIEGQVTVRDSVGGPDRPVTVGDSLPPGGQLITQGDARAKVVLPEEGSFVRVGADSSLTVLELGANESGPISRFGLLQGKMWVVLDETTGGEAVVETPGGTATARGQMSVEYHSNYAGTGAPLFLVTCLSGVCSVSNPFGGVALTPGQQAEVVGSGVGPGEPHPMDPDQLADWEENNPEVGGPKDITATVSPTAASATVPPGVTPSATLSPTPSYTPSYTPSPTPLGPPFLIANTDANVRGGPGTVYPILGVLRESERADVVGQDQTRTWYVVVFPRSPDGRGWVWGQLVTLGGDTSNIPVIAAPPTPTFTPTATWTPSPTWTPSATWTPSLTPTLTPTFTATRGTSFPQPSISANPNPVTAGCDLTNTVITWSAPGAGSATLNGERATVPTGQKAVCVLQDTTFTLIANYPGGVQQTVSVVVKAEFSSSNGEGRNAAAFAPNR